MTKTLFISDLDGTLLNKEARLSENSAKIIRELVENGLLFTIATARSLSSISILEELGLYLPCVQLNGVLMYDFSKHEYIGSTSIEPADARSVLDILRENDRMSFVYKADKQYGIHVEFEELKNDVEKEFFEARRDKDYKSFSKVGTITAEDNDNVIYFTMVDEYERLFPIYKKISEIPGVRPTLYSDNYSDLYFLEVFSSKATKAHGMLDIKKRIGAERVVAFGDNLNDIEMLRSADIGIAVADAVEEVRSIADIVIGESYNDGVANYLLENCI